MKRKCGAALLAIHALLFAPPVRADDGENPGFSDETETLELLLDAEVGVATKKARPIRESPGVVTLVTREDIAISGARDLMDVLMLVPGFDFALDVGGAVGVGFRGNWGHEGKVLVLIDGLELNENLYSTTQFDRHIPVDRIERVEIIRGPGSAIYGGYAELAVVNVITRRPAGKAEGFGRVGWGQLEGTFGRRYVSLGAGSKQGGFETGFAANISQGNRSVRSFTDFDGDTFSLREHGGAESAHVNAFAAWRGAELRLLWDDYRLETKNGYGANTAKTYVTMFQTFAADLRGTWKPVVMLQVTPHVGWKRQLPWRVTDDDPDGIFYDKRADRMTAGVSGSLVPGESIDVLLGVDAHQDRAKLNAPPGDGLQTPFDGEKTEITYENTGAYGQVLWDSSVANIAAGARYEHHSQFGDSFVPRLGLTKRAGNVNVKLLAARAFRAPGIENLAINPGLRPERTTVLEAEAGYRLSESAYGTVNVFDVTIEDPIVFDYDTESEAEGYFNFDRTGTRGAEATIRIRTWQADASLSASLYTTAGKNRVPIYAAPGHDGVLVGLAPLKLTAAVGVRPSRGLLFGGSLVLLGPRRGFLEGDGTGTLTGTAGEEDPAALLNVHMDFEEIRHGMTARVALYNAADTKYRFLQAYDGGHAPQPGLDREILGELSFAF